MSISPIPQLVFQTAFEIEIQKRIDYKVLFLFSWLLVEYELVCIAFLLQTQKSFPWLDAMFKLYLF